MKSACLPLALVMLTLGLAVSCRKPGAQLPSDVVAEVGGRFLRVADVERAWKTRGSSRADKAAFVRELVEEEALYVRALQAGLDQNPELQQTWKSLLIGKLKERDLEPRQEKTVIADADIQAFYHAQEQRYTVPARRRLAMLHLRASAQMSDAKRAELKSRLEEARRQALQRGPQDPGFGPLAIAFSEDQATRYKGGDLGWINVGGTARLNPQVLAAGLALQEKGALSDVLEAPDGFYLLKLMDTHEASIKPLSGVQASIRGELLRQRRREMDRDFREEAKRLANARILPDRIAALELPALHAGPAGPSDP